jgi:hypothetical protein
MTILSKKALEHKREYNRKRTRELLKTFSATLPKEEYQEISDYLLQVGMNKAEFVRWAYDKLREE